MSINIRYFPEGCLLEIFKHLDNLNDLNTCKLVCKKFKTVIEGDYLWNLKNNELDSNILIRDRDRDHRDISAEDYFYLNREFNNIYKSKKECFITYPHIVKKKLILDKIRTEIKLTYMYFYDFKINDPDNLIESIEFETMEFDGSIDCWDLRSFSQKIYSHKINGIWDIEKWFAFYRPFIGNFYSLGILNITLKNNTTSINYPEISFMKYYYCPNDRFIFADLGIVDHDRFLLFHNGKTVPYKELKDLPEDLKMDKIPKYIKLKRLKERTSNKKENIRKFKEIDKIVNG